MPIGAVGKQNLVNLCRGEHQSPGLWVGEPGAELAQAAADKREPYAPRTPYFVGKTG